MWIIGRSSLFATLLLVVTRAEVAPGVTVSTITSSYGLAEGPHWDHTTQKLYFVDIYNQYIHRYDPQTQAITQAYIGNGPVGVAVPVENSSNQFVAGAGTDFVLITWDSDKNATNPSVTTLASIDGDRNGTRFNDGKVDSHGRFWGGTMGAEQCGVVEPDEGSLYRIGPNYAPHRVISPVTISNGLAWNSADDKFYYIDSTTRQIVSYDYNPQTGGITNKQVVFDVRANNINGLPDGMTIDADDNLWIALYGGSSVINVNPETGTLIHTIELPAPAITSVAFGGPLLDVLYVTSASSGVQVEKYPDAGCLFAIRGLGVRGVLPNRFKLH